MGKIRVQLSEYNSNWEQQYADEQNRIKEALGDKANHIEHIGSTSIKRLEAKPIIDILVGVPSLEEVATYTKEKEPFIKMIIMKAKEGGFRE